MSNDILLNNLDVLASIIFIYKPNYLPPSTVLNINAKQAKSVYFQEYYKFPCKFNSHSKLS